MPTTKIPTQLELMLPLLETLKENGPMPVRDVCDALAAKMAIDPDLRTREAMFQNGRRANLFDRQVRWTRQNAVLANLIPKGKRGVWELSDSGHKTLNMAQPGVVFVVAKTDEGLVLWSQAMTAMGYIEKESLQLIFTSPPYPLNHQREYGGWEASRYVDTLMEHLEKARTLLTPDGSMVLNLSDVYSSGAPVLNTYQEELVLLLKRQGMNLAGKEVWVNPGKPKTTQWVTKTRERIANGFETFYWWSPSPHPKANNRSILEPYSNRFMDTLNRGGEMRKFASGSRQVTPGKVKFAKDNGGKIPFNVTTVGSDASNTRYAEYCRKHALPLHPARMPQRLAEKYVLLTTDVGDTVYDPFGGSLNTLAVCQRLGRRCITSESCLQYLQGGISRINHEPSFAESFRLFSYDVGLDFAAG